MGTEATTGGEVNPTYYLELAAVNAFGALAFVTVLLITVFLTMRRRMRRETFRRSEAEK